METVRDGTVCFIVGKGEVLLAHIQYLDGVKKWNGVGGFVEIRESPLEAVIREVKEEIGIDISIKNISKVAKISDYPGLLLHVFVANNLQDITPQIHDSTIKSLKWFKIDKIPYSEMWEGNDKWLPQILKKY